MMNIYNNNELVFDINNYLLEKKIYLESEIWVSFIDQNMFIHTQDIINNYSNNFLGNPLYSFSY
jgi:hypothetical protein